MTTYRCELWVGTTWVDSVDVEADSQATAAERCAEQMLLEPGVEHEIRVIRESDAHEETMIVTGSAIYSAVRQEP